MHPPTPVLLEPLWDANNVAHYLQTSRSWVYQRSAAGKLPCLRIGGLLRFEPEVIRAYAQGQTPPGSLPFQRR